MTPRMQLMKLMKPMKMTLLSTSQTTLMFNLRLSTDWAMPLLMPVLLLLLLPLLMLPSQVSMLVLLPFLPVIMDTVLRRRHTHLLQATILPRASAIATRAEAAMDTVQATAMATATATAMATAMATATVDGTAMATEPVAMATETVDGTAMATEP